MCHCHSFTTTSTQILTLGIWPYHMLPAPFPWGLPFDICDHVVLTSCMTDCKTSSTWRLPRSATSMESCQALWARAVLYFECLMAEHSVRNPGKPCHSLLREKNLFTVRPMIVLRRPQDIFPIGCKYLELCVCMLTYMWAHYMSMEAKGWPLCYY